MGNAAGDFCFSFRTSCLVFKCSFGYLHLISLNRSHIWPPLRPLGPEPFLLLILLALLEHLDLMGNHTQCNNKCGEFYCVLCTARAKARARDGHARPGQRARTYCTLSSKPPDGVGEVERGLVLDQIEATQVEWRARIVTVPCRRSPPPAGAFGRRVRPWPRGSATAPPRPPKTIHIHIFPHVNV